MDPREAYVPVDGCRLFCRDVGAGPPAVVLHGGPSFDHTYLLPELDRLADFFHHVEDPELVAEEVGRLLRRMTSVA